ncbi:MFS transporter, partial [Streptomyces sp. NPDC002922]
VAGSGSPRGAGYATAFVDASKPAWWIITGCGLAVLLVGALTSGQWARETAQRTAGRLAAPAGAETGSGAGYGGQASVSAKA